MKNNQKGITLIALVVTIIVLLILAAISISAVISDDGIITKAQNSKIKTEIGNEKEYLNLAVASSKLNKSNDNYLSAITSEELQKELDKLVGENKTLVSGTNTLTVLFVDSNRSYSVYSDGTFMESDNAAGVLDGNGTQSIPYKIQSLEDLVAFSNTVNDGYSYESEYVILDRDLDFYSEKSYVNPNDTELFGDYNGDGVTEGIKAELTKQNYCGFKAIGNSSETPFNGFFDGKGYTINNIYVYSTGKASMFGYNNGEIKNINLKDGYIIGEKSDISGLVINNYGLIENCSTELTIQSKLNAPIGYSTFSAGIALKNGDYSNTNAIIRNCINRSTIIAPYTCNVGGIVSSCYGNVEGCINYGTLQGTTVDISGLHCNAGGIAASISGSSAVIKNCINKGNISGYEQIGGILGQDHTSKADSVIDCINERSYKWR